MFFSGNEEHQLRRNRTSASADRSRRQESRRGRRTRGNYLLMLYKKHFLMI